MEHIVYAPNTLLREEEILKMKDTIAELSDHELSSEDNVILSTETEPDEYSHDDSEDFAELHSYKKNKYISANS